MQAHEMEQVRDGEIAANADVKTPSADDIIRAQPLNNLGSESK